MKERYCEPNLPNSRVRRVFVSGLLPENLLNELRDMMIIPYRLGKSKNISDEIGYHPDLLVNNYHKGLWFCEHDPKYLPKGIPFGLFKESETELGDFYPLDCAFNNFRIRNALVCGKRSDYLTQAYAEYEDLVIIYVPQHYIKCSTILVSKHAVITTDKEIGKAMRKNGFDVLTVHNTGEIKLHGYPCGFLGGCAGKISEDTLVFTGDLNKYKYADDIRDFCLDHKVYCLSLSNDPLYDYGGILPITEFTTNEDEDVSWQFEEAERILELKD